MDKIIFTRSCWGSDGDQGLLADGPVGVGALHPAVQMLFGQGPHGGEAQQGHRQKQGDLDPQRSTLLGGAL